MLGKREPETYGSETFDQILGSLREDFEEVNLGYFQSNHEGELIDRIHQVYEEDWQGLVINAGAFTHYSYALFDALNILDIPIIEVHMSHIFSREKFRHTSVISPACQGMISGFGKDSYHLGISALMRIHSS